MAHSAVPPEEEDYDSAADSDFDAPASPSTGDESEDSNVDEHGKKRKQDRDGDLEMGSGDEGVVAQGRKKRRKKAGKGKGKRKGDGAQADDGEDIEVEEEDEGGVGIRVRLRSGRGGEASKKAAIPKASEATANIDEIWARMNDPKANVAQSDEASKDSLGDDSTHLLPAGKPAATESSDQQKSVASPRSLRDSEPTISIPHTYTFAGQTTTSTKTVPLSSSAAQSYLNCLNKSSPTSQKSSQVIQEKEILPAGPPVRRPLARKSLIEPNLTCYIASRGHILPPRADLPRSIGGGGSLKQLSLAGAEPLLGKGNGPIHSPFKLGGTTSKKDKGEKLNTVEKSKLDWQSEVDRLGLREELEKAGKDRGSYLQRRDFLDRVEMAGEDRARKARLAGS